MPGLEVLAGSHAAIRDPNLCLWAGTRLRLARAARRRESAKRRSRERADAVAELHGCVNAAHFARLRPGDTVPPVYVLSAARQGRPAEVQADLANARLLLRFPALAREALRFAILESLFRIDEGELFTFPGRELWRGRPEDARRRWENVVERAGERLRRARGAAGALGFIDAVRSLREAGS